MRTPTPCALAAAATTAALFLAGCEQERRAEAKTSVASAEVKTKMPEGAVSDEQLQRAANVAVRIAGTQPEPVGPPPAPDATTAPDPAPVPSAPPASGSTPGPTPRPR